MLSYTTWHKHYTVREESSLTYFYFLKGELMPTCPKCGGEMVFVKNVIYKCFPNLPDSPKIDIYKRPVCNPNI